MNKPVFDTDYWRTRAEEARTVAAQLTEPTAQRAMWDIAKSYDALAGNAEGGGREAWGADIFDRRTSRLMHMVSCASFDELQDWMTGLISEQPALEFAATFAIPANAPEDYRRALEALQDPPIEG